MRTLDEHLKKRGASANLARHLGCSKGLVTAWRQGKHLPESQTRKKIEAFIGPVDWESEAIDLAARIESSGKRASEIAAACGVSLATVYAWRRGNHAPALRYVPALRSLLGPLCPVCQSPDAQHVQKSAACLNRALHAAEQEIALLRCNLETRGPK
jgi:DNA-binding transcriptional regulator YiaG